MRKVTLKITSSIRTLIAVIVISVIIPLLPIKPYYLHVAIYIFMWAYLALAWNILHAYLGLFSLSQPAFFGIGAYILYFLLIGYGIPSLCAIWAAACLSSLFALFIGFISFRFGLKGIFFCLASLAAPEILRDIFIAFPQTTGGHMGLIMPKAEPSLFNLTFTEKYGYYYFILILYFVSVFFLQKLNKIKYFWRAIKENEDVAASVGINPMKYKILAYLLSAFLTSLGGSFYALYAGYINPEIVFGFELMMEIMVIGVVGGGHVLGPLLSSSLLVPIGEALRITLGGTFQGIHILLYGAVLVTILKLKPSGILEG